MLRSSRTAVVALLALSAVATTACSAASEGHLGPATDAGGGESSAPPPTDGWEGRTNVEAVFEASCSGCHGTQWSSCWNVQESASSVQGAISSGFMPRGAALSPSDKSTVLTWFMQGAPCAGTAPPAPEGGVFLGGEAPVGLAANALLER